MSSNRRVQRSQTLIDCLEPRLHLSGGPAPTLQAGSAVPVSFISAPPPELVWSDNGDPAVTGYRVYRKSPNQTKGADWQNLTPVALSATATGYALTNDPSFNPSEISGYKVQRVYSTNNLIYAGYTSVGTGLGSQPRDRILNGNLVR